jgi:hypothetical protein
MISLINLIYKDTGKVSISSVILFTPYICLEVPSTLSFPFTSNLHNYSMRMAPPLAMLPVQTSMASRGTRRTITRDSEISIQLIIPQSMVDI